MLEPFDEIEEWQTKCAHYVLLFGLRTSTNATQQWFEQMNRDFRRTTHSRKDSLDALQPTSQEEAVRHDLQFQLYPTSMNYALRFGHQSVLIDGKSVWTMGGFGTVDGRHRRLKTIEVLNIDNGDIQRLDNHSLGKHTQKNSINRRDCVNKHRSFFRWSNDDEDISSDSLPEEKESRSFRSTRGLPIYSSYRYWRSQSFHSRIPSTRIESASDYCEIRVSSTD